MKVRGGAKQEENIKFGSHNYNHELLIAMELKAALTAAGFRVLGPPASVDHALDLVSEERLHAAVLYFRSRWRESHARRS